MNSLQTVGQREGLPQVALQLVQVQHLGAFRRLVRPLDLHAEVAEDGEGLVDPAAEGEISQ